MVDRRYDIQVAAKELRSSRMLASFRKLDLVILDKLGFLPFAQDGGNCSSNCAPICMSGSRSL